MPTTKKDPDVDEAADQPTDQLTDPVPAPEQPVYVGPAAQETKYTLVVKIGPKWYVYEHARHPNFDWMYCMITVSPTETHYHYAPEMTLYSFVESDDLNMAGITRILKTRDANFPDLSTMQKITCED